MGDPKKLAQKIGASFNIPAVQCEALQSQDYTAPPAPKCLMKDMFLPDDPSYQDIWWKPLLLTLANIWVLQFWAEEANPLAPSDPHPLAMSVVELRWCMGRCITFSKQDILKYLGSAVPEAKDGDMGIPQADSTASPTMTDVRDMWLSPMETPLVDDTTVPSAEPDTETQRDLPTGQVASPAKLENQVTPTAGSVDKLANPPTPSGHTVNERWEYSQ